MKKENGKKRKEYVSPQFETMEIDVEEGFAASGTQIDGRVNDFGTFSFGVGDGGETMGDF